LLQRKNGRKCELVSSAPAWLLLLGRSHAAEWLRDRPRGMAGTAEGDVIQHA
jgi:hypothetical protein